MTKRRRRVVAGLSTVGLVGTTMAATFGAAPALAQDVSLPHTVVVSHLNNPRQLDLVPADDALLIAEAGRGGHQATITDPEGGKQGIGFTGSISLVLDPARSAGQRPHRIVTGLLSAGAAEAAPGQPVGSGAVGSDGVAANRLGSIAVQETYFPANLPANRQNGRLLLTRPYQSQKTSVANITAFERRHDPDGKGFDSDPYAVIDYRGGWLVADAAGNDVLKVSRTGAVSVFHVFPNVTTGPCASQYDPKKPFKGCNFVPTSMAADSHGNVYVGGLSSLTPGQGQVVELNARGHRVATWFGFSAVTGVALGRDGSVYVSQLFAPQAHPFNPQITGVLTRVHNGTRQNTDVPFPAGVAVDSHNNVYVSAWSIMPAGGAGIPGVDTSGQVWRLHF
ncbi:MAG: ScyD/ScyE family protein [Jatrophihabitans sp.]|uniref:ScyD/ScyE family protein n=1 Tax=Jatrophihabitans sp. TaxID=1932789 RepID=UPI003F8176AB